MPLDASLRGRSLCRSYRELIGLFQGLGLVSRPLREIAGRGGYAGALGVRHDVDHHLERAVLMALIDRDLGVSASYYLLPPGDYGLSENYYGRLVDRRIEHSPRLAAAARLLVALGHEVGLHNNFIQLSQQTGRPPDDLLREELAYFRDEGVEIVGTAAHGSDFARRYRFVNYELFAQCMRRETADAAVIGGDDFRYRLGSLDMSDFGLGYEAYFLGDAFRLSDTGGAIVTSRRAEPQRQVQEPVPAVDASLADRVRSSLNDGAALLVHADHWLFSELGGEADSVLDGLRRSGGRRPPTVPALTSLDYLEDFLAMLQANRRVRFLRYDDLVSADDPALPPRERCAAEAAAWQTAMAEGERDPADVYLCLHYNADDEPEAVDAVAALHRRRGIPYSLLTFARWLSPSAGIVEPYPLDWEALRRDVDAGLASVGYLNNALHLCDGDTAAAAREFDADVAALRRRGLGCAVAMPWGRAMPSRDMPDPVLVDWWQLTDSAPLWVYNRFGIHWTGHYVDTVLREALAGGDAEDPLRWFRSRCATPGRYLALLHPHHYNGARQGRSGG